MEKETMGTVISVIKQWWLKVNRKPARVHAMDGAAFPHIIKVKYTIDGKDYICRKWIGAGNNVPDKGTTIKVTYWEDKPSKQAVICAGYFQPMECVLSQLTIMWTRKMTLPMISRFLSKTL